jgi:hypothetical protein
MMPKGRVEVSMLLAPPSIRDDRRPTITKPADAGFFVVADEA